MVSTLLGSGIRIGVLAVDSFKKIKHFNSSTIPDLIQGSRDRDRDRNILKRLFGKESAAVSKVTVIVMSLSINSRSTVEMIIESQRSFEHRTVRRY